MTETLKKKISDVRDLGNIGLDPEQIVSEFEKTLEKYFPLKAYDVDNKTCVEYRIISDTDSDLMFFQIGSYVNKVFTIFKGLFKPLEDLGFEDIKVKRINDVWWLTFKTDKVGS